LKIKFVVASSIEEANSFARNVLGKDADYSGIALEFANEWNRCMFQTMEKYPVAFECIKMVGSTQYRMDEQTKIYRQTLYDDNYASNVFARGIPEEDYAKFIAERAKEYRDSIEPDIETMAGSSLQEGIYECTSGISLNRSRMSESQVDNVKLELRLDVERKFHPLCCDSLKYIFDHEFGHILDDFLHLQSDSVINCLYKSRKREQLTEELCEYAWHNNTKPHIAEFIAESWGEYQNNPCCRALAKQVGKRIEELYNRQ